MAPLLSRAGRLLLVPFCTVPALGEASSGPLPSFASEVRSTLGAPLDARIDAGPIDQAMPDGECFGWWPEGSEPAGLELDLTIIEVRGKRTIKLASRAPVSAPKVRVTLTVGCVPSTRATHVFDWMLKAPPEPAAPVQAATAPVTLADTKRFADPGTTVITRDGDSLATLARLVYPADAARQAQFIAALRNHNPDLVALAKESTIAPGTRIVFPDLRDLSGIAPSQSLGPALGKSPPALDSAPRVALLPRKVETPAPSVPAGQVRAKPSGNLKPSGISSASPPAALPATTSPARADRGSQMLRLSSPEIDLTRAARTSAEQRTAIRQRRLLLDADDQMAAILSLQNAVKQLETRLQALSTEPKANDKQVEKSGAERDTVRLKSAQQVTAVSEAPAESDRAPDTPVNVPVADKPLISAGAPPAQAVPSSAPPAPAAAPAKPLQPPPAPIHVGAWWNDPVWLALAGAGLLILIGGWFWTRREVRVKQPPAPSRAIEEVSVPAETAEAETMDLTTPPEEPLAPPMLQPAPQPMEETIRMQAHEVARTPAPAAQSDEDSTARFDLDPTPAASLDLSLDDRPDEDRVRRLQYMYERFPELMSRTVSIDDADSVINAARLYYEEGQADRACELLTFGVEERPQEVRFWLAQFEIFRLENRPADFSELAAKFHVLFSYAPSWPKVRHVGHELDPANPLFAAGRDVLAGDAHFDPVVENWLNAPMDFTADALMSDLRREMFDQFNVDRSDFDTLPSRMGAHR